MREFYVSCRIKDFVLVQAKLERYEFSKQIDVSSKGKKLKIKYFLVFEVQKN